MRIISSKDLDFKENFDEVLARAKTDIKSVSTIVTGIMDEIALEGDTALRKHISKFDNWTPSSGEDLLISCADMKKTYENN